MYTNYHTHSRYCDGKGEPLEYVEYALNHGFSHLGFSGHAPVPFENTFAISQEDFADYCAEIQSLKQYFKGKIDIKLGLEIDYIPGILEDFTPLMEKGNLDYCIGSVHLVNKRSNPEALWFIDGSHQETYDKGLNTIFDGNIREGVKAFFYQNNEMICNAKPTIVGHFDKIVMHNRNRYFTYDEPWFQDLLMETVHLIKEQHLIAEINTRGLYKKRHDDFYPAKSTIQKMNELNIPVLVGSDAHSPENLDQFEGAFEFLRAINYRNVITSL